jgi:hypothetical protein
MSFRPGPVIATFPQKAGLSGVPEIERVTTVD